MLNIKIITPEKTMFEGTAEQITLPGTNGSFQVLNSHAALVSNLVKGTIYVKTNNDNLKFDIQDGIVEILNNQVVVLV